MKSILLPVLALGAIVSLHAAQGPDMNDPKSKSSYALGVDIANNLKRSGLDLDGASVAAGLADGIGGKSKLTDEQVMQTLSALRDEMSAKAQARAASAGQENQKKGEEFMASNAKKEGVKATASGLQYKVLTAGKGKTPKATDTVKVHYHGTLIDGTVFDSSVQRNEPIEFPVNGVIQGWQEALQMMKEGDKWQIVIPARLAYGDRGAGQDIGPGSTLVFDVELIQVK
jgi:FKBP-type peptidyl-prolyl cis-trans isomerase FklB